MAMARVALGLLGVASAQQAGTVVKEASPPMPLEHCTRASGCTAESAAVTMDSNWRWVHGVGGYENCFTDGKWSEKFCPDGVNCAKNCALEGIDARGYSQTYGVDAVPGGVELKFVSSGGNVGSRIYLTDGDESYKVFKLKNREFTVDVDASSLACGLNGALYFVEMDGNGGKGKGSNEAGAKFGTGYCDAQCPHDVKWQNGVGNVDGKTGMCCFEMDIWEANREAAAFTPHPCSVKGPYRCNGTSCGDGATGERYMGVCDKDGCDFNAYRMGHERHYGAGSDFEVDSTKPLTVVTQFVTSDGTDTGDLVDIRRLYIQNGKLILNANSSIPGVQGNSVTDAFCSAQKTKFLDPDDHKAKGGLRAMGEALDRGMVLALSLWDDGATQMRWLDSSWPAAEAHSSRLGVTRGPCDSSDNSPMHLRQTHPGATVKYTNLRYGEIGTTFTAGSRRLASVFV